MPLELKHKKLELRTYPYTYVRTAVMKSLLFNKEDYDKMLKMSFNEIAKFMQESNYKKEINESAIEHSGADLLEIALNRNLSNSFKKLIRISTGGLSYLIKEYTIRKDIDDIKTILRGKFTGTQDKFILDSITAAGTLSLEHLTSLLKLGSIEDILKNNKIMAFDLLKESFNEYNEKKTLVGIENAFDKFYYKHLIKFSKYLPKQGALFREFLMREVEILNILTLLRLKKTRLDKEAIKKFIIPSGNKSSRLLSLADVDDIDELSRAMEKTEYKDVVKKGFEEYKEKGSLITLETDLYKYLLKQAITLLHLHPLSVDVILGYMFAKDIEVRNLKIIVKGKQLSLSEEFIESQLVF